MTFRIRWAVSAASLALVVGCDGAGDGGSGPGPQPQPVASITVSPSTFSLVVGQTQALTAQTKDANGTMLTGRYVVWVTSDQAVATVSLQGVVSAVGAGSATISATSEGKTGIAAVTVTPAPPPSGVSGDNWDFRAAGFEDGPIILGTGYRPGGRIAALTGALDVSTTSVTGKLAVWGGCINDELKAFTGTRNGLDLDMVSTGSVTIHVTGRLSADMRGFTGTYVATGGPCGSQAGPLPMTGLRAELKGVWSDDKVTLTIDLPATPTGRGSYALSGTAVFTDNPCFPGQSQVSNAARGRLVFPDVTNGSNVYLFDGEVTTDMKQMRYFYFLDQGSCPTNLSGGGTLLRR